VEQEQRSETLRHHTSAFSTPRGEFLYPEFSEVRQIVLKFWVSQFICCKVLELRKRRGEKFANMMQARHEGSFLGDDHHDDDAFYEAATENVRRGGQTPPTPATPLELETPRTLPDGSNAEQLTPRTPRSDDEGVTTPPSEDGEHAPGTADLSYRPGSTRIVSSPPRTAASSGGTMGWAVQVDASITPSSSRASTRGNVKTPWSSRVNFADLHELGNLSGEANGEDAGKRARNDDDSVSSVYTLI
jgi:hypothetical protein